MGIGLLEWAVSHSLKNILGGMNHTSDESSLSWPIWLYGIYAFHPDDLGLG